VIGVVSLVIGFASGVGHSARRGGTNSLPIGSVASGGGKGFMVPAEVVALREPVLLVVEDEVLIRLSVSDFLRNEGFIVIEAGSAREALTVLKARSDVSLVVTDIRMSGASEGLDLIREIRRSFPAVKIITASAYQISEPVEATIAKPYSLDRLLSVIKSLLGI
jgi:two-component system, response regulator PdtaR